MSNYKKLKEKNQIILQSDTIYEEQYEKLKGGVYELWNAGSMFSGYIPGFSMIEEKDKLVKFKSGIVSDVISDTEKFLREETKHMYKELKITHKIGLIFHGKPGTGKTSACMLIMKELVEKYQAICLVATGKRTSFISTSISRIREVQDNPIVLFVDELESSFRAEEEDWLTFLDGTNSFDNLIFMGCTNYLDKIPARIKYRKSRIKYLYNIDSLPQQVYREYLRDRVPSMEDAKIHEFAFKAEEKNLTIDQLKHAMIDHKLEGVSIDEAIKEACTFNDKDEYIGNKKEDTKEEEDD